MRLAVVIPALDEIVELPRTIERLRRLEPEPFSIVVADGGSTDGTWEWLEQAAEQRVLKAVRAPRGRGNQMNAGAAAASGDVLLFLHADAELPRRAIALIGERLDRDDQMVGGAFTIAFARRPESPWSMPLVARGINARTRVTATATGDQAIFVRRHAFERTGGFKAWPLFEDVDLVTRLKQHGRFRILTGPVVISDRRYAEFGPWRTTVLMWRLRLRYWRGASPDELKQAFVDVRNPK